MRVALAEDGALFREGLLMLLEAAGHEVVGCTADGDSLVELLAKEPADIAILDIRMPPEPDGGLVTAERLRAMHPGIGLLFLSHYAESHYLMRILQIGTDAIGYRLKEKVGSVDVLTDTLTRISSGEIVIEPVLAKRLVERPRGEKKESSPRCPSASWTCCASWQRAGRTTASPGSCSSRRRRSRSTSPASSESSTCTPTPPSITAGCWPCSPTCARSATGTDNAPMSSPRSAPPLAPVAVTNTVAVREPDRIRAWPGAR
jgi:DNA-binding NarL/FixJ family response regulator